MPRGNDSRPVYQTVTMYQWICGCCGMPWNWDTTRQCLNVECHHAYCERDCTVEAYQVRVEQPRGSTSSRRS